MKLDHFKQQTSNLFAENRLLKIGFLILLIISGYNATALSGVGKNMRTVIVPIGAAGHLEVTGDTASDDYLLHMARYITGLIGNYSAPNARVQFQELLKLYAPEKLGEANDYFMNLADKIEKYPTVASMVLWDGKDALKTPKDMLQITTTRHRIVEGVTTEVDHVVYEVKYELRNGRFVILSINAADEKVLRQAKEDMNTNVRAPKEEVTVNPNHSNKPATTGGR